MTKLRTLMIFFFWLGNYAIYDNRLFNNVEKERLDYVALLHRYNEVKDAGQMLIGKYAEWKGLTVHEAYEVFDMNLED